MKVVAIVQARMGSSRLPGKVLQDLHGETMLSRVVNRLRDSLALDDVIIATTTAPDDQAIVLAAQRLGVSAVRGSETDVLSRYAQAARFAGADAIVRVTSDCPLIDPGVVDAVINRLDGSVDYVSNTHLRTYPRGLDVEALHRDTLMRIERMATSPAAREHVTAFVLEAPTLFRTAQVTAATDDSDLRWTVDTHEDLAFVRAIYAQLDLGERNVPYADVLAAVRAHPDLVLLNAHVIQKDWSTRAE